MAVAFAVRVGAACVTVVFNPELVRVGVVYILPWNAANSDGQRHSIRWKCRADARPHPNKCRHRRQSNPKVRNFLPHFPIMNLEHETSSKWLMIWFSNREHKIHHNGDREHKIHHNQDMTSMGTVRGSQCFVQTRIRMVFFKSLIVPSNIVCAFRWFSTLSN